MSTKECTKCKEVKPLDDFYKIKKGAKIRSFCKKCDNKMSKAYKDRSKTHISSYNKQYKSERKTEISTYNKKYNVENRATIQKRQTAHAQNRLKIDPNFKMAKTLRNRICGLLKGEKSKTTRELTGCDFDFFVKWIRFQFDETMSFKNHGKVWHVDHVNPCNTFNLTDIVAQKQCFHWTNMRPLDAYTNQSRSHDTDLVEIAAHKKVVQKFLEFIKNDDIKYNYTMLI
jgi:hypothetical protein